MSDRLEDAVLNRINGERIADRQIDELIGIAKGLTADHVINQAEVEFLDKWLAANQAISDQPVVRTLYHRISQMLKSGPINQEEKAELLDTLNQFASDPIDGIGEPMKATSLPLDIPAPALTFPGKRYGFTGTFIFGNRKACEEAVITLGATAGSLTQKTNVLVIGSYATESWKHSAFGNKIITAAAWRDKGLSICLVSEPHWRTFL